MSASVADRVTLSKRLLLAACLAVAASFVFVPSASAGNFDEEKMGCTGEAPATCPTGTVGQPYSMTIYLMPPDGGRGEDFGCATFHTTSGTFPPGLSISDEGFISGTPTQAGNFRFYMTVKYDKEPGCQKPFSDDEFIIPINPGVPQLPKLTIGPETTPSGTVGTAYQLQMTANLPDAKTWSIVSGGLPPGLAINSSTGGITGTPTAAGSFFFTVQAVINAQQTDTKTLGIHVREPLAISRPDGFDMDAIALTEVGLDFSETLAATGGFGPYKWTQTGVLPPGMTFDTASATLAGKPNRAGVFRFGIAAADAEGRTATYAATLEVAPRLAITTRRLRTGRVGTVYQEGMRTVGGVGPVSWRIRRGPVPRGLIFEPTTGTLFGMPKRAGTWVIRVEGVDALGVRVASNVVVTIKATAKSRALLAKKR
jgi:hypothetical protein